MDTAMMDPATLQERMTAEEGARELLKAYIDKNLREGVDFGAVIPRRGAKPSLLKPGAEKMCLLLQLRPHFVPDRATLAMAGNAPGLFAYICKLVHTPTGVVIGEGRGAADLSEKQGWTVNSAVKIATKRAQVDAVLRVAALSDFFTQDLEDGAEDAADRAYQAHQAQQARQQPRPETTRPQSAPGRAERPAETQQRSEAPNGTGNAAITDAQQAQIRDLVGPAGMTVDALLQTQGLTTLGDLSAAKAERIIARLKARAATPDPNSPVADTPRLTAVR